MKLLSSLGQTAEFFLQKMFVCLFSLAKKMLFWFRFVVVLFIYALLGV